MYRNGLKRLVDVIISMMVLLILLPIYLVLAVMIFRRLGTPILFTQERPGLHGKPFIMYKFRTMRDIRDAEGNLLSDAERITTLGKFLRSTSLDELPEFYNVLKGDMSIVGPRPLLTQYLDRYSPDQARRHEASPGITGWAQINGRNAIAWEEKFKLDVWYIDHCSLWLDVKIIALTVWKVLRREGISQQGEVTTTEFMGTQDSSYDKQ